MTTWHWRINALCRHGRKLYPLIQARPVRNGIGLHISQTANIIKLILRSSSVLPYDNVLLSYISFIDICCFSCAK